MGLMSVAPSGAGSYWVVGHGGKKGAVKPVLLEWRNRKWKRHKAPSSRGEAVLAQPRRGTQELELLSVD